MIYKNTALLLPSTHRMILKYDPDTGWLFIPNLKARIPNEFGGYYVETNSQGFRSSIQFHKEPQECPRILFFGDSNTAADGVSNNERFSDLVCEVLGAKTYNYGIPGSGTDQQLLIYEKFAQKVEADLIVLCITVNNIERIKVRYFETVERSTGKYILMPKPYFTLENNELKIHNVPVPKERPSIESVSPDKYLAPLSRGGEFQASKLVQKIERLSLLKKVTNPITSKLKLDIRSKLDKLTNFNPHTDYKSFNTSGWLLMSSILNRFSSRVFPIPISLDSNNPDPRKMSSEITKYWRDDNISTKFENILTKLLSIKFSERDQDKTDYSTDPDVSDNVYVMY